MSNCHSIEVNASNITERFDLISSLISEQFRAAWTAQPIGMDPRPASITWAAADGVSFCTATMPPQRLVNANSRPSGSGLYYIYTADQPSRVRLHTGSVLRLQGCDFLIHDADMPLDWSVHCDYTTRSLLVDKDLFHEYVPHDSPLIGRPLKFDYGVGKILSEIMDAACDMTSAGKFEQGGPKLARAFLDLMTMVPPRGDVPDRAASENALQLRRSQVKAYIDKHFAQPDLCTASIARYLHLTPRYLQMAFSSEETTPSDYMRRRRLIACASMLQNPEMAARTITDIALSCGFNSSAYFSTEFRRAYGISPKRYRTIHLTAPSRSVARCGPRPAEQADRAPEDV
jgi:AraC-like DNA-binding protein